MPRSGPPTYTYTLPPVYLAIPGTTILVAQHNDPLEDIANTFNSVQPVVWGGTGASTPAGAKATLGFLFQSWQAYPTATGTADAIALAPTDPLLALTGGTPMSFTVGASSNTGAATLNVSGLGAKAIRKIASGTDVAVVAGDLPAGTRQSVVYDTAANAAAGGWVLVSGSGAPFKAVHLQIFTGSGTYTPNANMVYCVMEALGGGGGSGPAVAQANLNGGAPGGGAGSRSITVASRAAVGASQTVTIGAGGTAGVVAGPVAGGSGGDTSVGTLCVGKGGSGGAAIGSNSSTGPLGGVAGTGDITATGQPGGSGQVAVRTQANIISGEGGSTIYGAGGRSIGGTTSSTGLSGTGYGSGAGGGFYYSDTVSGAGQAGQAGLVVIWEYCSA